MARSTKRAAIEVQLSHAEKAIILAKAEASGVTTSKFCRAIILKSEKIVPKTDELAIVECNRAAGMVWRMWQDIRDGKVQVSRETEQRIIDSVVELKKRTAMIASSIAKGDASWV